MTATHTPATPALPEDLAALLAAFRAGKRVALARAISTVENQRPGFQGLLETLHAEAGRAHRIGITGPPGAGKSTLTTALVQRFRAAGETVAVIAVDPTSPFTGGALLGDRIRMNELTLDEGVFIRSMATRGSLGGLALATEEVADVMDAFGFDRIVVETVGVGQSELDIAAAADTTLVVVVPESGDAIQAMKAGLMEAADLFVVNKADRPGAERMARELSMMLHYRTGDTMRNVPAHHGVDHRRVRAKAGVSADALKERQASDDAAAAAGAPDARADAPPSAWEIPILQTSADRDAGIEPVGGALDAHRAWLEASGERTRRVRARLADRVRAQVRRTLVNRAWLERGGREMLERELDALERHEVSPYAVAARIVRAACGEGRP